VSRVDEKAMEKISEKIKSILDLND